MEQQQAAAQQAAPGALLATRADYLGVGELGLCKLFCGQTQGDSYGHAWAASDSILSPTNSCGRALGYMHGSTWLSLQQQELWRAAFFAHRALPGFVSPSQLSVPPWLQLPAGSSRGVCQPWGKWGLHGAAVPAAARVVVSRAAATQPFPVQQRPGCCCHPWPSAQQHWHGLDCSCGKSNCRYLY